MKIEIICRDGSPLGVHLDDVMGKEHRIGVGGAELALLTMCEAWHKSGHQVILYNNPLRDGSPFKQRPMTEFNPDEDRDILIIFRSPNWKALTAKGRKVWWSCDQMTIDDFAKFSKVPDKIVTISQYHANFFRDVYGITNTVSIDLPVRSWEYTEKVEKIPGRCIFCSIPDRGVLQLNAIWPRIVEQVPEASLAITSDWRLWSEWAHEDMIMHYKVAFARHKNVVYLGAIRRPQLVELQMQSDILLYPCIYEELFCITAAECQIAGAYPITSDMGALRTTNMGGIIPGSPIDVHWQDECVRQVVELLTNRELLEEKRRALQEKAHKRFDIEEILRQWENVFSG
jgi:glycosyltransferase involved in cell wall biosynthesis